jgi:hypothetical protein
MLDHVSAAFGVDETIDVYESRDVSVQWSSLVSSATRGHPEGAHNFGLIAGPDSERISVHKNLFAHHKYRNPALAAGPAQSVNNVVYNARAGFTHHNPARGWFEVVGNFFKRGPDYELNPLYLDDEDRFGGRPRYFVFGNRAEGAKGCGSDSTDNWRGCVGDEEYPPVPPALRAKKAFGFARKRESACFVPVTSGVTEGTLLDAVGAFPRDVVDARAVRNVRNGDGRVGAYVVRDLLEGLRVLPAEKDSDEDGIPDAWEVEHGLDPRDAGDNQRKMASGYPAIEEYINGISR